MPDHSRTHRWLAGAAAVLGLLALGAGDPYPADSRSAATGDASFVTAIDVARLIRDGRPDVRVVDLRPDSLFESYHVPGAERIGRDELATRTWSPDERVILYAEDDADAIRAGALLRRRGVKRADVMRGGLLSWVDQIVQPRLATLDTTATPAEQVRRREHLELSRYFGGTPYVSPGVERAGGSGQGTGASRASEAAAVGRILRRGC